jgi:hypothetical protein
MSFQSQMRRFKRSKLMISSFLQEDNLKFKISISYHIFNSKKRKNQEKRRRKKRIQMLKKKMRLQSQSLKKLFQTSKNSGLE